MNIIFDLGGVVFNWNPKELVNGILKNEQDRNILYKSLFEHSDWIALDRGTISKNSAASNASARSGIDKELVLEVLSGVPKALTPIEETVQLFKVLKDKGHKLYVLSNMHLESSKSILQNNDFWEMFDGIVFSCDVNLVKPEKAIYEHILNKYELIATDSIFIDDTLINLDIAKIFKIGTIHYQNPKQLTDELKNKGVI